MKYLPVFERFVPPSAAGYCHELYEQFGFEFKIKKARLTKLGDYRYDPRTRHHVITINNDLNEYAFLVTYLHEIAHLVTFDEYGRKVSPHGHEWKTNFRKVSSPILTVDVFPENVLMSLQRYLKNPRAASCSDPILFQVLRSFDQPNGKVLLKGLEPGSLFEFQGNIYRYEEKRRTRMVCTRVATGRKYLIPQLAEVKPQIVRD